MATAASRRSMEDETMTNASAWTYRSLSYPYREEVCECPRPLCELLADALEERGMPYATVMSRLVEVNPACTMFKDRTMELHKAAERARGEERAALREAFHESYDHERLVPDADRAYHRDPVLFALIDGAPAGIIQGAHQIVRERYVARREDELTQAIAALPNTSVRRYLLANRGEIRGMVSAENLKAVDLRGAWKPAKGYRHQCSGGVTVRLSDAYVVGRQQNAYDDTVVYAIPVEGAVTQDVLKCIRAYLAACRTATGIAGVGYTLHLDDARDGVLLVSQRHSIPD